jgi:3',5'-cyclic AMP phosphodiesterase CpdA
MRNIFRFITFSILIIFAFGNLNGQSHDHPRIYHAPQYTAEWSAPSVHPDRIVLNLTEDPSSSMNVAWRTSADVDTAYAEIAIATAAPKFWRNAKDYLAQTETLDLQEIAESKAIANFHSVNFRGLVPNTLYAYRVGDGKHWSEWLQFTTASDQAEPFSFLYVGDAQNNILELWSRLIRQGYKSNPDASFIIHAGDLVNHANNDQQWNEWFQAGSFIHSTVPSISVPGNHEYRALQQGGKRQLSLYWQPQFNFPKNGPKSLPETAYFVDYQGVRFIGLDTNVEDPDQVKWLIKVLESNPNKWTICTFHHPLFSASGGRDNKKLRKVLKPIFDKYKVDLVLQGHDHSYARGRTQPLEYNLTSGTNKHDQTGTVYVVSVSGGKMYNLAENGWDGLDAERERAAENTQLVQSISIDGNRLSYQSITAVGDLYDAFDIIKNEGGPNTFVELRANAGNERRHDNTISYFDQLPLDIKTKVLAEYQGHTITRVFAKEEAGKITYDVRLIDEDEKSIDLRVDVNGNIINE